MRNRLPRNFPTTSLVLFGIVASGGFTRPVAAQNPEMPQRVADVKLAVATNKQALAQYTWVEQVTISLKGEQKKQEHFRVVMGPDGKPQKTSLDPPPSDDSSGGGRLKKHIVAKKKQEYKEYADQMKDLARQYVPPDKDRLQQAYQQGNSTLGPSGGGPGQIQLVIHNYVKPQDSMTLLFDKTGRTGSAPDCYLHGRSKGCDEPDGPVRPSAGRD